MRGRRSLLLCLSLAAAIAAGVASARDLHQPVPPTRLFSRSGGWYILKGPGGCTAETRTVNDFLTYSLKRGLAYAILSNPVMSIPAGKYTVGFKIGPPIPYSGNVEAMVAPANSHAIQAAFNQQSFVQIANARWIEFTLGSNPHRVSTDGAMEALRAMAVCNAAKSDPFTRAGGGKGS
jgi:hypothetical protein